jgi:hypothetical protein
MLYYLLSFLIRDRLIWHGSSRMKGECAILSRAIGWRVNRESNHWMTVRDVLLLISEKVKEKGKEIADIIMMMMRRKKAK